MYNLNKTAFILAFILAFVINCKVIVNQWLSNIFLFIKRKKQRKMGERKKLLFTRICLL